MCCDLINKADSFPIVSTTHARTQTPTHTLTDKIKIHRIKTITQKHYNTIEVRIGDIDPICEPDSEASANVMDKYQFKALKRRTNIGELKPNYNRVKNTQGELSVKGEFETIIRNKNRRFKTKFIVVRVHIDNLPLISRDMLIELGMMVVEPNGSLKETNELIMKQISGMNEPKSTKELIRYV